MEKPKKKKLDIINLLAYIFIFIITIIFIIIINSLAKQDLGSRSKSIVIYIVVLDSMI